MKHPYGRTSMSRLATCSEAVQLVMNRASDYLNISILCGHRNKADQEDAYDNGFSQVHYPDSEHNHEDKDGNPESDAVDAGIYRPDLRNVDYGDLPAFAVLYGVLHVCAQQVGCVVIWGHDWDHDFNFMEHDSKDLPHFTILTIEEYNRRKK